MSCRWCVHFRRPEESNWRRYDNLGQCTLNPVWIDVVDGHFCGQLVTRAPDSPDSTLMQQHYERMNDESRAEMTERRRRIKLEATAKDLRKKIKALKVGDT